MNGSINTERLQLARSASAHLVYAGYPDSLPATGKYPVPGVNAAALSVLSEQVSGNALIDTLNLLSGGAVTNFSVMAMGVYPYITIHHHSALSRLLFLPGQLSQKVNRA